MQKKGQEGAESQVKRDCRGVCVQMRRAGQVQSSWVQTQLGMEQSQHEKGLPALPRSLRQDKPNQPLNHWATSFSQPCFTQPNMGTRWASII